MLISETSKRIPKSQIAIVLVGFPVIATLITLLLLNRTLITNIGLDFFNTFWIIIICWYLIQIYVISRILKRDGWSWADIGFTLNTKRTIYFSVGYLVFAFGLLLFVEYKLANSVLDSEKLKEIVKMSPKNTTSRIIFIFLGLVAGISEEIVYRGFAIKSLISNNINKWLAVFIAAIPFVFQHGIKAYQVNWSIWYLAWGLIFGCLFIILKKLNVNIIIHWLVILSAMLAILQAIN